MYIKNLWKGSVKQQLDFWIQQAAILGVCITWIVSGCLLIWSIYAIRRFLKQRGDLDHPNLNLRQLVLHSAAFGLFLVSVVTFELYNLAYSSVLHVRIHNHEKTKPVYFKIEIVLNIFLIAFSFLSQVFLCAIFLHLSRKPQAVQSDELTDETSTTIATLEVQSFDEDAELQARIWNAFTRDKHGIDESMENSSERDDGSVKPE